MRGKAPMKCVGRQARKLRMTQMKQRLVIAGFHIDLRPRLDAIVDDEIQSVAFANGRNCTVRKSRYNRLISASLAMSTSSPSFPQSDRRRWCDAGMTTSI
jgi:hypothetical protein